MLCQICAVFERPMADIADVNTRLVMNKRHMLTEIRRGFAMMAALPTAKRLHVHVNPAVKSRQ